MVCVIFVWYLLSSFTLKFSGSLTIVGYYLWIKKYELNQKQFFRFG